MWHLLPSLRDPQRPRVFQIGFNRCGTKSLYSFFRKNGYRSVHWANGKLAEGMELARLEEKPLLHYVGRWDVYTDMERVAHRRFFRGPVLNKLLRLKGKDKLEIPIQAYRYFRTLDRQYPGSKFILNVRDVDLWVRSRLRFEAADGGKYRFCRHGDRAHESEKALVACWKEHWHEHIREVRDYFDGRPDDLLTFHIERDSIHDLVAFFDRAGYDLDPGHWGWRNRTRPAET
jgi:hypothetical protein